MNRKETYLVVILSEIRSQMLYRALAKSFRSPETSAIFQELLILEQNHEAKVRAAFDTEFPGEKKPEFSPLIPEIKDVKLTEPLEVLEFASSREDIAAAVYQELAGQTKDPEIKALLLKFAAEEDEHKQVILAEMQRLQGAMIWFDPSELNGLFE